MILPNISPSISIQSNIPLFGMCTTNLSTFKTMKSRASEVSYNHDSKNKKKIKNNQVIAFKI